MRITRINEFQAQNGKGDALRDLISSFVSMAKSSESCQPCQALQQQEYPGENNLRLKL